MQTSCYCILDLLCVNCFRITSETSSSLQECNVIKNFIIFIFKFISCHSYAWQNAFIFFLANQTQISVSRLLVRQNKLGKLKPLGTYNKRHKFFNQKCHVFNTLLKAKSQFSDLHCQLVSCWFLRSKVIYCSRNLWWQTTFPMTKMRTFYTTIYLTEILSNLENLTLHIFNSLFTHIIRNIVS